ncbi:microtubule-associated proteins 1A/1B light chain 3C-like [Zootoca vivipara]|uniref:microtubule-associated proteins 1A/1B light chain 3C-like n=1 Tax=Zootoca vivipara TaxID=8524 RepID=UPI00293BBEC4|nr:microtubule-associated proteins 1A/1B light chain 3C-like [Zootoca vivipara]
MLRFQSDDRPYKQRKSLASRMKETTGVRTKYPSKIPIILERYQKERTLPPLGRVKFLVSGDLSMSQFVYSLRARLSLTATQAFYLLVDNKSLPCLSLTVSEVYAAHKDDDGFLYIIYASQDTFGDVGP